MNKKLIARLSGLALIAIAGGVLATAASAGGGGACPNIVKPVICSNGKIYVNLCYAQRDKAKDCVPYE